YIGIIRALTELRPDAVLQRDHRAFTDRGALAVSRWVGSESEGAFEIPYVIVWEIGADGRICREEAYDLGQLDIARARFAELAAPRIELDARPADGEAAAFPHVAGTMRAFRDAFARRDWDALAAQMAPDLVVDDHRVLGWETVRGTPAYLNTLL